MPWAPFRVAIVSSCCSDSSGQNPAARCSSRCIDSPSLLARESVPSATGIPAASQRGTGGGVRPK